MSPETRLLTLAVDYRCSHPEGDCRGLARANFLSATPRGEARIKSIELDRIEMRPGEQSAVAHVTIQRDTKHKSTLHLALVSGRWMLTSPVQ
jgi:hypothetical protein